MKMKIEPGQYIRKDIVPNEELIETLPLDKQQSIIENKVKHYIVLSVDDKQIDVFLWNGTPPINSQVFAYDDIAASYDIAEIPAKDVKCIPVERSCNKNGLDCKITVATKYLWGEKEYIQPLGHYYWNGREWADNSAFWNSYGG